MNGYRIVALLVLLLTLAIAGVACIEAQNGAAAWSVTTLIGSVLAGLFYRLGEPPRRRR